MSQVRISSPRSVTVTGTTVENEPVIKSDGASSDIMEWQASTGTSTVKLREGSGNTVVLDVDGSLELADKIKSITSATTVGAVQIYDTSQDSDGGAWRKKCKGLSWFDEAASATRSARSEFPAMALIVADNTSASTVTIYDLDDPAMPLWMQFTQVDSYPTIVMLGRDTPDITSVTMLNGRLWVGLDNAGYAEGMAFINFTSDNGTMFFDGNWDFGQNIANRNTATQLVTPSAWGSIVSNAVNDVAAIVLEGSPIGELGLPIPTVAAACSGGISWIHPNGDVFDSTAYGAFDTIDTFGKDEWVAANNAATEVVRIYKTAFADGHLEDASREYAANSVPAILDGDPVIASTSKGVAVGTPAGLSLIKDNPSKSTDSAVAHVTSDYNTGFQIGDIRGAWLAYGISCGHSHADHVQTAFSVKANTLTETGTLTKTAVATGADLTGFSGFSASNYLSRAYDADFDFTDGKFSVMGWVKVVASSAYQAIANRFNTGDTAKGWLMYIDPSEQVYLYVHGASNVNSGVTGVLTEGWHFICGVSDGANIKIYADGVLGNSATLAAGDLSNSAAELQVGIDYDLASYPQLGSLSLLRVSATVPTPTQIKEIYEAEKPLFAAGAKCLLQSDDSSANIVNALAYDKSADILHVLQEGDTIGDTMFRGLEAVDTFGGKTHGWNYSANTKGSAAGGVVARGRVATGGGVLVDLPALDVRAELNDGDDKLPDDGKLHFSGVTTDATGTTIGVIPIAENETVSVNATIKAQQYNDQDGEWLFADSKRTFYRDIGGARAQRAVSYSLTDESTASMSAGIGGGTNSIVIEVTGKAATRLVWTAEVEVQRISDKTYER